MSHVQLSTFGLLCLVIRLKRVNKERYSTFISPILTFDVLAQSGWHKGKWHF